MFSKTKIRRLIKKFGSASKLGKACGLHKTTISKYLSGERKRLSGPTVTLLELFYLQSF